MDTIFDRCYALSNRILRDIERVSASYQRDKIELFCNRLTLNRLIRCFRISNDMYDIYDGPAYPHKITYYGYEILACNDVEEDVILVCNYATGGVYELLLMLGLEVLDDRTMRVAWSHKADNRPFNIMNIREISHSIARDMWRRFRGRELVDNKQTTCSEGVIYEYSDDHPDGYPVIRTFNGFVPVSRNFESGMPLDTLLGGVASDVEK